MHHETIVIAIFAVLFLIVLGLLIRNTMKLNLWRKLTQEGFDCCIQAVELQVAGKDWKPPMQRAAEIKRQLDMV